MAVLAVAAAGAAIGYGITAGTAYASLGLSIGWAVDGRLPGLIFPETESRNVDLECRDHADPRPDRGRH